MKSKKEIKKWLLENCVDTYGNLDLINLDFRDFDGDVWICYMKVKKDLYQYGQEVGGNLEQYMQTVNGEFITQSLEDNEKYMLNEEELNTIVKTPKKLTKEELIDILKNEYGIEKGDRKNE